MPQAEDLHGQNTVILEAGGRRSVPPQRATPPPAPEPPRPPAPEAPRPRAPEPPRPRARTQPPPPVPPARGSRPSGRPPPAPIYDEELHSAPTMIIDIRRIRGRSR